MPAPRKQRLVVLFDGTGNTPLSSTNVYEFTRRIEDFDGEICQRFFYDPGVGTDKVSKVLDLRDGATGIGLEQNLMEGYDWLVRRYTPGDEIYVLGFSRGAFTARSLVGLIRKCGLVDVSTPQLLNAALNLYKDLDAAPDGEACMTFRARFSKEVKIHFIGVWDTVGSLGIPGTKYTENGVFKWHDTTLSRIVERAYHAIALDEHRPSFNVIPWTDPDGKLKPGQLDVEQRWFVGAHANVGGGYEHDTLSQISLEWMMGKATKAGLKMEPFVIVPEPWAAEPRDSFREFASGFYAKVVNFFKGGKGRYYRTLDRDHAKHTAVGVTVDQTVWDRWKKFETYRPPTLVNAKVRPPE